MIERKVFFEMCQRCAVLPKIAGIAIDVPKELLLKWNGAEYYPVGYELFFDNKGNPIHSAILHDLQANSIVRVDFKEVDIYNGTQK